MKFNLKNAFFSILILITIPLVIALFVDNDYNVENEILIQQPKAVVFDYVKSLRNQDKFSKWANIDPWGFDGSMDYTFNLMLLTSSFQNTMKKDFGIGLKNLKEQLEPTTN